MAGLGKRREAFNAFLLHDFGVYTRIMALLPLLANGAPPSAEVSNVPRPFDFSGVRLRSFVLKVLIFGPDAQNLISRLATRRRLAVGEDWSQDVQLGEQSELRYSYHVLCDEHYYGEGCSDYCRPRDDPFGHYACDELGARVCLPGWRGEYCSEGWTWRGCVPGRSPRPVSEGRVPPSDPCSLHHCAGALGSDLENDYKCTCPQGFYGKNCEVSAMTCADGPCFNGGTCAEKPAGGYTCHCPLGYHGSNCEKKIDRCTHNPCLNSGLCLDLGRRVLCKCRPGFAGPRCERNLDDCAGHPCANGGTCLDGANSYTCSCTLGYGGQDCSLRVDACGSSPCLNSGTCYTHFSGHVCECSAGYMGSSCEFEVQSPTPASSRRLAADDPFPMALAVSFALGLVTLALGVCAALAVLRQVRQGRAAGKVTGGLLSLASRGGSGPSSPSPGWRLRVPCSLGAARASANWSESVGAVWLLASQGMMSEISGEALQSLATGYMISEIS
uniref:Delta-like protein n=1 Tax=Chelydra serpentina TaxID=8475 RepID=A0A8C3SVU9_CHESE